MNKNELAKRVQETCYLTGHFVLRSGLVADFYFDKYLFEADPVLLRAVAEQAAPLVPDGTEVLAGLELGGVPISTALSLLVGLPQVLVRKQAKTYGTAKLAEGPDVAGRRLLIVEDVITTGGQVVASTEELRALGAIVDTALCVIDRRSQPAPGNLAPGDLPPGNLPPGNLPPGNLPPGNPASDPDSLAAAGLRLISLFKLEDLSGPDRRPR